MMNNTLIRNGSLVGGQWHDADNKIAVVNPADNKVITKVADANTALAIQAVEQADKAFGMWSTMPAHQRAEVLLKWYDLILEHINELAELLTLEQGKPLTEAKGEINYSASFLQWFAEEAKRVYGDVIPSHQTNQQFVVIKQAVGVVGAITPWNFPSAMIMRKAAAALASGCTFVVKPDIQTPLSALALAELSIQAGVPKGVFNVLASSDAQGIGEVLTTHPSIAKFTFTGSTAVGKQLMAQCATTVKRVSMELGGNAPFIVFEDADIEKAVAGAIASKYRNAGQTCICTNRIFVHEKVVQEFTDKLLAQVKTLKVGNGFSPTSDIGPLINSNAVDKVEKLLTESINQGAKLLYGGKRNEAGQNFFSPTVVSNVTPDMLIASHEVFGPVASILTFNSEQEVITLANNTEAGLAAYFYSENISRVWRVAKALSYGMVGINETAISNAYTPFGGIKQSGVGREGSKYGLDDYIDIKYLCMGC